MRRFLAVAAFTLAVLVGSTGVVMTVRPKYVAPAEPQMLIKETP
jgi:hypothetical protein